MESTTKRPKLSRMIWSLPSHEEEDDSPPQSHPSSAATGPVLSQCIYQSRAATGPVFHRLHTWSPTTQGYRIRCESTDTDSAVCKRGRPSATRCRPEKTCMHIALFHSPLRVHIHFVSVPCFVLVSLMCVTVQA